jgi:hypothetical protein
MKIPRRQFLHLAAGVVWLPAVSRFAMAQTYPSRPVRIIVAAAAGGSTDITARLIGQWLTERLGQSFFVENRPGGNNNIGTEAVVRAPGDGYTLLLANSVNAINASLYDRLSYNFVRDVAPVARISDAPYVLVVHPQFPARSVPEFIAYAKAVVTAWESLQHRHIWHGRQQSWCADGLGPITSAPAATPWIPPPYAGGRGRVEQRPPHLPAPHLKIERARLERLDRGSCGSPRAGRTAGQIAAGARPPQDEDDERMVVPRRTPAESTGAFFASGATLQRAAKRTPSEAPTRLMGPSATRAR